MIIQKFKTEKIFIKAAVDFIKKICEKRSKIFIALSGGKTPEPLYKALSKEPLPFERIEFYIVDERYVPLDHKDSNYKMIYKNLFKKLKSTKKKFNLHNFDTSLTIKNSLKNYEKELPKKPFDLMILGIGEDGHTASLFPHSKALKTKKILAHTQTGEASCEPASDGKNLALPKLRRASLSISDRLTMTFQIIMKSKNILVLLKNKQKIIEKLSSKEMDKNSLPAIKLTKHRNLNIFHFS